MSSVVTIVGARPQFVKAAVVSRALIAAGITERIIHTGQHYDHSLSEIFFEEMGIPQPQHNLKVGSGSHGEQTGAMLAGIEGILIKHPPSWLLVYGDTNSTLAGALAAAKLHIPVAHVEAGLRSFNRRMPEEVNRVATDHLSSLLLCPTEVAVAHLCSEGVCDAAERHGFCRQVKLVGDVMCDATRMFGEIASRHSTVLATHGLERRGFVLATIHRAENTDDPQRLATICEALAIVGKTLPVLLPLHPRTRKILASGGLAHLLSRGDVRIIDPIGYLDMLMCERNARCIVTDSGGVQKEAYFAGVPCVTLRDETEWVELVELGWNKLVPPHDPAAIVDAVERAKVGKSGASPYGDGHASERIAALLSAARPPCP